MMGYKEMLFSVKRIGIVRPYNEKAKSMANEYQPESNLLGNESKTVVWFHLWRALPGSRNQIIIVIMITSNRTEIKEVLFEI